MLPSCTVGLVRLRLAPACSVAALWCVALGCAGDTQTPFPEGLEPLEDNLAQLPAGSQADPYPESLGVAITSTDDYIQGHARGYIQAPLDEVWTALRDSDVVVDRRRVTSWVGTPIFVDGADYALSIAHVVQDLITIEYVVEWRYGVWEGSLDAPMSFVARFQKVEGSTALALFEGSVVGIAVSDSVTEIQIIEHLSASLQTEDDVALWLEDIYIDAHAQSHGEALPSFD